MGKSYDIALIPGDGTGPEVLKEGVKVLDAVAAVEGLKLNFTSYDFGGERYLRTGEILPQSAIGELGKYDAIYLGAIGHPDVKPGILEKGILLTIRFELDQYINLRPGEALSGCRDPAEGQGPGAYRLRRGPGKYRRPLYRSRRRHHEGHARTRWRSRTMIYSRYQVERCLRYAFEYTRKRNRKKNLALVGKTNVLTYVYDLWERAFHEIGEKEYPDIKREYYNVDATCMWMVKNPEWFDVMVTGNMFGDIITDLGAITQGGMGIAAGGNINPEGVSMFEPIGGSAPKYTGNEHHQSPGSHQRRPDDAGDPRRR